MRKMRTSNNSRRRIYENELGLHHEIQNLETFTLDTENSNQLKNTSENLKINPNYSLLEILMAKMEHKNKNLHNNSVYQKKMNSGNLTHSDIFCKTLNNRLEKKNKKGFVPNYSNGSSALLRFQVNTQKLKNNKEKICYTMNNTTKNSIQKDNKNIYNKKNNSIKNYNAFYSIPNIKNKIVMNKKICGISAYEIPYKINNTVTITSNEKICYNGLNKFKCINENKRIKVNTLYENTKSYVPKRYDIPSDVTQKKKLKKCVTDQKSLKIQINKPKNLNYPMNLKKNVQKKQISKYDNNKIKHKSFWEIINNKKNLLAISYHNKSNYNTENNIIKNNSIQKNSTKKNSIKEQNLKDKNKILSNHQPINSRTLYNTIYKKNLYNKEIKEVNQSVIKIIDEKNNKICYKVKFSSSFCKDKRSLDNEHLKVEANPQNNVKTIKRRIQKRNYSSLYIRGLDLMRKIGDSVEKYYDKKNRTMTGSHNERL